MNFEKPSSFENEKFVAINSIEDEIIGHECAPEEGLDCISRWHETNFDALAEIFEEELSNDPELLDKLNSPDRARILDVFMDKLNVRKEGGHKRAA